MDPWNAPPVRPAAPKTACPSCSCRGANALTCERVEVFESGASVRSRRRAVVRYRGPSPHDADGNLKSAEQAKAEDEWWARHRLERGLNTVGPDRLESAFAYQAMGMAPGAQRFGAYHDVQSGEARRQALVQAGEEPARAREIFDRYRQANADSAVVGYREAIASSPESAARLTQSVFGSYGFDVSGPEAIALASSSPSGP